MPGYLQGAMKISGPDFDPIRSLHRHDGYISLAWSHEDGFETLLSIRASELESYFPEFIEQLAKDSFVSMNGSYRKTATFRQSRTAKGMPIPYHSTNTLAFLCACYADIDFRNKGLTFNGALERALQMEAQGTLPPFSVVVDSGRGMWLLWLLHDSHDPNSAHRGGWTDNPNNHIQLYFRIQRELNRRLASLGSDPAAIDAARHIRVPGSLNGKIDRRVRWLAADPGDRVRSYGLQELAEILQVTPVLQNPVRRSQSTSNSNKRRGYEQASVNRLSALKCLSEIRGGMDHGNREQAVFYMAVFLRALRTPPAEAQRLVREMGARCRPPFPSTLCDRALRSACRRRQNLRVSYRRLAELFDISPGEAECIALRIGKPFPPALRFSSTDQVIQVVAESRQEHQQKRRAFIQNFVSKSGRVLSLREMEKLLQTHPFKASHVTVAADYKALNLESGQRRRPAHGEAREDTQLDLLAG